MTKRKADLGDGRRRPPKEPHHSTPALEALLSKRAIQPKQRPTYTPSPPPPVPSTTKLDPSLTAYSPTSLPHLLSRLTTFRLSTYPPPKPRSLSAPAMALAGWCNQGGKDRLVCGSCGRSWVVSTPSAASGGWNGEAGRLLETKVVVSVLEAHDRACPWRTRPCQPGLYRLSWTGPKGAAEDVVERARAIEASGVFDEDDEDSDERDPNDLPIRHPLEAEDLEGLAAAATLILSQRAARAQTRLASRLQTPEPGASTQTSIPLPPTPALVLALFGWTVESSPPPTLPAPSTRAPSTFRGSVPPPASSRRGSVIPPSPTKASAPAQAPSTDAILSCSLCLRRFGAWTLVADDRTARKPVDVLREHRDFCPYVDPLAGLPSPPSGSEAKAGWQVAKALVLRYASPGRIESLDTVAKRAGVGEAGQSPAERHRKVVGYVRGLLSGR